MDIKKYTEANRVAWNEVTPYHQKAKEGKFFRAFLEPGYSCLDKLITSKLNECGVQGKDVAQLGCNDGREILSLKNMGAKKTVGFDISDSFIEEGRKLAEMAKLTCEFVRTDIYEIPEDYNDSFDLIYISIGFLPWLPDLERFFKILFGENCCKFHFEKQKVTNNTLMDGLESILKEQKFQSGKISSINSSVAIISLIFIISFCGGLFFYFFG